MKEHQDQCVKGGKYIEAETARQRLCQFKRIEKEKQMIELTTNQKEDVCINKNILCRNYIIIKKKIILI